MKQFIKLIVLMLIGLVLNGCYSAKEKEAIEVCKRNCKYPLTFEVIETSSTSYPAKIDITTFKECYINRPKNMDDIVAMDVIAAADSVIMAARGMDMSHLTRTYPVYPDPVLVPDSFKIYGDSIDERDDYKIQYVNYYDKFKIDSIHTYTVKKYYPGYELFKVTYSGKNDFGVPCLDSSKFLIINDQILDLDNDDWWNSDVANDIEIIDTISINRFINNSPDKIFKSKDEFEKYLNNFESNFKLKN